MIPEKQMYLCASDSGADCASGGKTTFHFVTDSEDIAMTHALSFNNSWTTRGWYLKLPFRTTRQ